MRLRLWVRSPLRLVQRLRHVQHPRLNAGLPHGRLVLHLAPRVGGDDEVGPVLAELLHGSRTRRDFDTLLGYVDALSYIEVDLETWKLVGRIRRELSRGGNLIGFPDSITAALAIQHACAVYTLDGDFDRIPGLRLYRRASP